MTFNFGKKDELQSPGAGLPSAEAFFLNVAFKAGCFTMSDKRASSLFKKETDVMLKLAGEDESYDVFHPLLIPRVIGIEDSSRNWSVMMVLEHLNMVNRDILKIVEALMSGIKPRGEIDTALYKPEGDLDYDVLDRFQRNNAEYLDRVGELLREHGNLASSKRYRHPWFGGINAHQWHCLAAIHQRIHRRQIQKIVAMLGVV